MTQSNRVAIPRDKRTKPAHSATSLTEEARWRIVLAHTPTIEFVYAVISTGIYCRTSCPSRRPRRSNVRFFETSASAVAAGFRACRRCRPESTDSSHESPQASAEKQVKTACEFIRQRKGEAQLLEIAAHVGLSPRYFHGLFKQVMGSTPGVYAAAVRRENTGQLSVPETPAASVSDCAPYIIGLGDATDLLDLAPIDNSADAVPFMNFDPASYNYHPEALEGFDCINFNQEPLPEWNNDSDWDLLSLSQMNGESMEAQLNNFTSDYVDPSLLNSWTPPP